MVMACPGGNSYYMSTQDAVGGLTLTLLVTGIIVLFSLMLIYYLKNKNIETKYFWLFVCIVIVFAVLNCIQFLMFIR